MAPDECDHPCSGNENEICGSSWRLSVYGPNQIIDLSTPKATMSTPSVSTTTITTTAPTSTTTTMTKADDCRFDEVDEITIFDTGSQYKNNRRNGYLLIILLYN